MHQLTAAHRTLAFDTWVLVTRRDDGRSVEVRINDRGFSRPGIGLSWAAARRIGPTRRRRTGFSRVMATTGHQPPAHPGAEDRLAEPTCWWQWPSARRATRGAAARLESRRAGGDLRAAARPVRVRPSLRA
jgi:rare lipoprotein A (peptidoglycan hydrolase)